MKSDVELLASYWTISAGQPHADVEYSPFDFRDRVESAARAGFKGFGIWHSDLDHVLERRTLQEMKQILDDNGIQHVELEFLTDWFLEGERKKQFDIRMNQAWPWPDSLDALRAAPAHHELLMENERVRVIRTHIPAGDTVPLHTHRWSGVAYVIGASDFIRRDHDGNVLFDSRGAGLPSAPTIQWLNPLPPHTVENVGSCAISIFTVELKDSDRG